MNATTVEEKRDPGKSVAGTDRPVVLFVDDSPLARLVASRMIGAMGYDLLLAEDGVQGLEMARRHHPPLVLTDALMPNMDGREMCRLIKEDASCASTRVFVMTALCTTADYRHEAYTTFRVDGYLEKPIAPQDLSALLRRELAMKETSA